MQDRSIFIAAYSIYKPGSNIIWELAFTFLDLASQHLYFSGANLVIPLRKKKKKELIPGWTKFDPLTMDVSIFITCILKFEDQTPDPACSHYLCTTQLAASCMHVFHFRWQGLFFSLSFFISVDLLHVQYKTDRRASL